MAAAARGAAPAARPARPQAAALAATLPSILSPLPAESLRMVGEETCVWVNALLGRIYRDAARSAHFHDWLKRQLENALNRGAKAEERGYMDDLK